MSSSSAWLKLWVGAGEKVWGAVGGLGLLGGGGGSLSMVRGLIGLGGDFSLGRLLGGFEFPWF